MSADDLYDLLVTFRVKIKKWRIDPQDDIANREWSLKVYDRNLGKWVHTADLVRPGEDARIVSIEEYEEDK